MTGADAQIVSIVPWGDQAFMVRLEARIDPVVNARITALDAAIRDAAPAWLVDSVPSYAALMIVFDPLQVEASTAESFLRARLAAVARDPDVAPVARLHQVPVWYDSSVGPDLAAVAARCGLTVDEVIRCHSGGDYRVYLLGFRPGFPFLGTVDDRLVVPRLASPRTDVAAGSVGIAGRQTGIYPTRGPGGWSILGRTPWTMFDPTAPAPFRLCAGDRVRFVPIDGPTFETLSGAGRAG